MLAGPLSIFDRLVSRGGDGYNGDGVPLLTGVIVGLVVFTWASIEFVFNIDRVFEQEEAFERKLMHVFTFLSVWGMFMAGWSDAGAVPDWWRRHCEEAIAAGTMGDYSYNPSYCDVCNHIKPPRARHCKRCKRCVLNMDHHCEFLGRCVGHRNRKPFVISAVHMIPAAGICLSLLYDYLMYMIYVEQRSWGLFAQLSFLLVLGLICAFALAFAIFLALAHLSMMTKNMTTIEEKKHTTLLKEYAERRRQDRPPPAPHAFDYGSTFRNLCASLGPAWSWLLPLRNTPGDGVHWPAVGGAAAANAAGSMA